jgi:hypothetical protein
MPAYETVLFDPPAPMAQVTLRNPANGAICSDVPMLLDSGADVTFIPQTAIDLLEATPGPDKPYEPTSFDGSTSSALAVRLELFFCNRTFRGQFLLIDEAWGILGRNVLNAIPILLNGPKLVWSEHRLASSGH